jgi:hypothetical protein
MLNSASTVDHLRPSGRVWSDLYILPISSARLCAAALSCLWLEASVILPSAARSAA